MVTIKNPHLALIIGVLLVGVYLLGGYFGRLKADRRASENLIAYSDSIRSYQYKVASLEKTAYEKQQLIIEQKQAIASGLLKQAELKALNLKKVSEVTSLKAEIHILSDSIKHSGKIVVIHDTITNEDHNVIYLPFGFQDKTKYYQLYGEFSESADLSLDLTVPVAIDLYTGYNRKTKSYVATITSDNPFFKVSEIKSIKVEAKKPFYNKTWFKVATLGSAFAAGVLIAK